MSAKRILATAILGSLLGSLAIKLYPKRREILNALSEQGSELKSKSQGYADELLRRGLALAHLRRERETRISWGSALAGLLLGAGAALLLAPKSGKETRRHVQKFYNELSGTAQEVIRDFKTPGPDPFHAAKTLYPLKKSKRINKTPSKANLG